MHFTLIYEEIIGIVVGCITNIQIWYFFVKLLIDRWINLGMIPMNPIPIKNRWPIAPCAPSPNHFNNKFGM